MVFVEEQTPRVEQMLLEPRSQESVRRGRSELHEPVSMRASEHLAGEMSKRNV